MSMESMIHTGPTFSLKAGAALTANRLVKVDGTTNQMVHAGAGDLAIGLLVEDVASGDWGNVYAITGFGIMPITAGGAISVGNYAKVGANGKVVVEATAGTPTEFSIGQALTASTTDGDRILIVRAS